MSSRHTVNCEQHFPITTLFFKSNALKTCVFPSCQCLFLHLQMILSELFSSSASSSSFSSSSASSSSFSSTMSASTSTSTSALPTLRQALRQLPSSVRTAGPQPGTFPAQCAPLDLNLGPSQLSAHRWTSTWDLPSSVRTAGPQPGTFPAQCAPLDLNLDRMPEDMPENVRCECQKMPDKMP